MSVVLRYSVEGKEKDLVVGVIPCANLHGGDDIVFSHTSAIFMSSRQKNQLGLSTASKIGRSKILIAVIRA